ncbi:hypothetical protein IE53DRAFT_314080 [Violaceomyces palustris]|uniref:Uncharacterized protein n=1 Tax=Violaceomyces palustris TaxID=1673888 RepID=A0ACD0NZT1_9BASI|nr:hypothetical protein IE53DRAFT_314080 [Violaceomyces palustris]
MFRTSASLVSRVGVYNHVASLGRSAALLQPQATRTRRGKQQTHHRSDCSALLKSFSWPSCRSIHFSSSSWRPSSAPSRPPRSIKQIASHHRTPTTSESAPFPSRNLSPKTKSQPKVEALPFKMSTEYAERLFEANLEERMLPDRLSSVYRRAAFMYDKLFKRGENARNYDQSKSLRSVYLPVWIIDAEFELKCSGEQGRADASFILIHSSFPGHSHAWKPMDTMPMCPLPTPSDGKRPSNTRQIRTTDLSHFEPWKPSVHLKPKDVEIKGEIEVLPFTVSPLFLPEMLKKAPSDVLNFDQSSTDHSWSAKVKGLGLHEDFETRPITFQGSTLKLGLFASYPVMVPIHLGQATYTDQEGDEKTFTCVIGAWDSDGTHICEMENSDPWTWSAKEHFPLRTQNIVFHPFAPVTTSLTEILKLFRERKGVERANSDYKLMKEAKTAQDQRKAIEMNSKRSSEDFSDDLSNVLTEAKAIASVMGRIAGERSVELLGSVDWSTFESKEKEAWLSRVVRERNSEGKVSSESHPDKVSGLGKYINWSSPHIQRLSQGYRENRRYLIEGVEKALGTRMSLACIQRTGWNVDNAILKTTTATDASKGSVVGEDIRARMEKERLKPQWLKDLEAARMKSGVRRGS